MMNNLAEDLKQVLDWLKYLLSKWLVIGVVSILIGVYGVYVAIKDKPQYESHLTFALEEGNDGLSGAMSLAAEFGFSIGGGQSIFAGENILEIIKSRNIIERTLLSVDTLDKRPVTLADWYRSILKASTVKDKNSNYSNVSFPVGQDRKTFSYLQDTVLITLKEGIVRNFLNVGKADKRTSLFIINFRSPDEHFTKVFTEHLLRETTDYYTEIKTKRSKQTLDILESRVAHMKGNLNSAVTGRLEIQDANINPAFLKAQAPVQIKQVDAETYGAAYAELFKNLEMARVQYLKEIPLLQVIDDVNYPMKRIKLGKAKNGISYAIIGGLLMSFLFSIIYVLKKMNIIKSK